MRLRDPSKLWASCQTLRAVSSNAGNVALTLGLEAEDRIFINTPPYFTSGICHFLTLLANGGTLVAALNIVRETMGNA